LKKIGELFLQKISLGRKGRAGKADWKGRKTQYSWPPISLLAKSDNGNLWASKVQCHLFNLTKAGFLNKGSCLAPALNAGLLNKSSR